MEQTTNQSQPGLPLLSTKLDTSRHGWVLLSHVLTAAGSYSVLREWGESYWVVHFIQLILNKTQNPRRTLVACLVTANRQLG